MGRIAVVSVVTLWLIPVSILVNRVVPYPYMDEIFHVPQAQQYCRGNFRSWDPMITTPPGLYFLSLACVASLFPGLFCLQAVSSFSDSCSTSILRLTNGILAVLCSIIVYEIITHLKPAMDDKRATLLSVVLSLYPIHWFFTYLYYTDGASLTSVLAMYLLTLKKRYLFSSLLGALSVFTRQTNIIWVFFVACTGVLEFIQSHQKAIAEVDVLSMSKGKGTSNVEGALRTSNLRQRKGSYGAKSQIKVTSRSVPMEYSTGLLDEIQGLIIISWNHFWELLLVFSPFIVVFGGFIAFVFWNGSIVLGAKDAHAVSPHVAQMLYFGLVSALFMFPVNFSLAQATEFFRQLCKNKLLSIFQWLLALTIGLFSVKFFSIAHPYLLADNRHYTFYLWRKLINYCWSAKYLMVPLYFYSWFSIISNLAKNQKKLWVLAYVFACAATLVPAPLIEFRYFTVPFFFLVLHCNITDKSLLLLGIMYLSINCFTMFMFLFRPFSWKHQAGTQRFIW
ncbi:dol-P-Glc:Glc(2)Man(9)GlcNAc(2)-PP-Dol alpha-1,2-glucosyltransferase [Andrographis paniculata]|uniref:dol-P-Glc:Glc(2)Man(9)GlcNAc(2)-PP-Dol alpha-1,2-glucosyltransferase n=1 Tax=Andrographis paniculata TaxID=175694 RepID=UPI0021E8DA0D|nr:dol-P-Glc:Glc(2)Man(9)GlcNAc(2)-PP-Dol alpha-1,2-glucosyltransferase [Andrographis paniculata]